MAVPEDSAAVHADTRLRSLLARARQLKPETAIEPPLPTSDFSGDLGLPTPASTTRAHYFAAVEDAARHVYQSRAAATDIAAPAFIEIWDLFDILSVCGDQEQCDPALAWWLVEELLETQSIDGCRIVFDYLESRRERLVGQLFEKKNLIILRAFNELLRRLSRAEEAVFCGRVFVFLFQSFPLGARSSVNLKGDFHKENLTVFEEATEAVEEKTSGEDEAMTGVETTEVKDGETKNEDKTEEKTDEKPQETPDLKARLLADESVLYPAFWTMQQAFSNPPDYFFKLNKLDEFKVTLEATLAKFKGVPKVNQAAADHRGVKRSADELEDAEDEFTSTFNPKYLTSRELFALELSDLAFQRHILVQALILLDYLLSLTEKSKKKLIGFPNKSLQVDYTLSDADATWAHGIRRSISSYLTDGQLGGNQEGKYYHRMVETVLSRDKNWVRWKHEFCQPIRQPPVHSDDYNVAQNTAKRLCGPTRMRPSPMGALDLGFLRETDASGQHNGGQSELARAELPDASTLVRDVQNVDLDLEMANSEQEKAQLEDQKMSKTWRALRLMSKTKLNLFDKVDDGKNLACFLQEQDDEKADGEAMVTEKEEPNGDENAKEDDEPMADEELKTETNGSPTVVAAGTS